MKFNEIGLMAPTVYLPKSDVQLEKWAVVACDQFSSQPEYWEDAKKLVGDDPSTLNIVFPEAYLEEGGKEQRIENINQTMKSYLEKGILEEHKDCFVLMDRKTSQAPSRKGLVVALDLEHYDFSVGSQTLIRATEGTIVDRLPPRIKIRENAPLESPHIMVLLDDPDKTIIEPLFAKKANYKKVYDFELMKDSGHLEGYIIQDLNELKAIASKIAKLSEKEVFNSKYGVDDKGVLLYAMGDGNHSLATAKAIWEKLKSEASDKANVMDSAARFALVELVNVHDQGLQFEPIHRVMFNIDSSDLISKMQSFYKDQDVKLAYNTFKSESQMREAYKALSNGHNIMTVTNQEFGIIQVENPKLNLEVGTLQVFLDKYLKENSKTIVDYIHGSDVVIDLGSKQGNMGFFLPAMSKHELFKTVIVDGALPRKTFSMGEADEKRFYLECRKIK